MKDNISEAINDLNFSNELEIEPEKNLHYGRVTMSTDAYFLFTGNNKLEIDELENNKDEFTDNKYEFLVKSPNGAKGNPGENGSNAPAVNVDIVIHKLINNVHIKSLGGNGGEGGDGDDGAVGGNGGDAARGAKNGGAGGNGGSGGAGGNGGNGSTPKVRISYASETDDAKVIVLAVDDTPSEDNISYGGKGGTGGKSGKGGEGGTGGLNGDKKTHASNGKTGPSGAQGKNGKPGKDGTVIMKHDNGINM